MSKTKKQVRVRTKKGKTYMRSMMVNSGSAEAISRRATQVSLKQDSAKPDKPGLISRLFFRGGKNQSRSALAAMNHDGPNAGSDHSLWAIIYKTHFDAHAGRLDSARLRDTTKRGVEPRRSADEDHSYSRTMTVFGMALNSTPRYASGNELDWADRRYRVPAPSAHGYSEQEHVPQDPNKWVR